MLIEEIDVLRTDAVGEIFAWRVASDTFADVGIRAGDVLIVRRVTEIADGDLVMFALDGRRYIRRARHEGAGFWRFEAETPGRQLLFGWIRDIQLEGKVIALIRHV